MLTQKCRPRISEFWPNFTFLLEQQIKFVLTSQLCCLRSLRLFKISLCDMTSRACPLTILQRGKEYSGLPQETTICSPYSYMFTICSPYNHHIITMCSQYVHNMFTIRSLYGHQPDVRNTIFDFRPETLSYIMRLFKSRAYVSHIQILTYTMPFDPFKVNKTRTVSTSACIKHKNDSKNQLQLLSSYMGKGKHMVF